MNLFEILKQFKAIEPDPNFTDKSKRMILATPQEAPASSVPGTFAARGFRAFFRILETSAAFVLVGFFILLITGGFPGSHYLAPVQYSVIDPQGLHAEAQAVDMQIELANITYPESAAPVSTAAVATPTSTSGSTASSSLVIPSAATSSPSAATTASGTATSTTSSTLSIDQALRELSQ